MREQLEKIYQETPITHRYDVRDNEINISFLNGAKVEITGSRDTTYLVQFINRDTNTLVFENTINTNRYCYPYAQYYINWEIKVYENKQLIRHDFFDLADKKVLIMFESNAIGDTLAWIPALEEFRKKHNCKLVASTFKNEWFKEKYPEIEFIERGVAVTDCYASYRIGWFYNEDNSFMSQLNPTDFKTRPLQATSFDILGLEYCEIKPLISIPETPTKIKGDYVVIAPHASAHAKYWNHPNGWQTVINYLKAIGYKVVILSQEKLGDKWHDSKISPRILYDITDKTGDRPITERMIDIRDAKLFIGVGSGLSWLSWAAGTKTILISGFSEPYSEFNDCYRVFNNSEGVCTGCFNKKRLDAGDWDWCPEHKGTERQFECTKTIAAADVIKRINEALGI